MADAGIIRKFLNLVIDWPGPQGPGWANYHTFLDNKDPNDTSKKNNHGKPWFVGWAYRDQNEFITRVLWADKQSFLHHSYVGMAKQSTCRAAKEAGKPPRAVRDADKALTLKSLYIDVDVKPNDPNHYPDLATAYAALNAFRQKVNLPEPSAIVETGGGFHAHWASDRALTVAEWRPYAVGLKTAALREGFKLDPTVTADPARVLRLPETHNFKFNPPYPVQVVQWGPIYVFDAQLAHLKSVAPPARDPKADLPTSAIVPGNESLFDTPDAAFAALVPDDALQADIAPQGAFLVDPRPIFAKAGCPWLREALRSGGAEFDQPQWNLSVLCTAFMENGNAIAHEISKAHSGYAHADTQALYDRKVADRADRGVGYPSCDAIKGARGQACATCPHFTKGKSPLNIRPDTRTGFRSGSSRRATGQSSSAAEKRKPLRGGLLGSDEALQLLNSHYLVGKSELEVAIFRIKDDGSLAFAPQEQFKLDVANIFVEPSDGSKKPIPVEKFWREHPCRHERKLVFKPGGTTEPNEFNLWRGFGVAPSKGWQQQRRLLRHIWQIVCRRDKEKFKYLLRWLAWAVQNPDRHSEVIIVLKSRKQGTGKSTIGVVMLKIFGDHGVLVDDKDRLLGKFNDWLETASFVLGEEIMWAGDHKSTDKLKSMITANTLQIERKNGAIRQVKNRMHPMITTNHDHAVDAGVGDRRNVVLEISDERACDKSWFDPLYRDLEAGGYSEFLWLLQNLRLGDWHPREIIKTAEATEQQRMSADSISQWARACIEADAIVGGSLGLHATTPDLGTKIASEVLREAYTGYCKQQSLRAVDVGSFGSACTEMYGPRKKLKALPNSKRRPYGYDVPTGNNWQRKLEKRLGIKKWPAHLAKRPVSRSVPLSAVAAPQETPANSGLVSLSHLSHLS